MQKTHFLADKDTVSFLSYLTNLLDGKRTLDFQHASGTYQTIHDALTAYSWPNKRIDIQTPNGQIVINAHSNYQANKKVLDTLESGIRSAAQATGNSVNLAAWAQAIMTWGGVYTKRGNGKWLDGQRNNFAAYLTRALSALGQNNDAITAAMADLRSNAGTTKIHSLLLPNFVIYDSRVAAALAWLAFQWANSEPQHIPEHLRFACMRANSTKDKKRSPHPETFPYFAATGDKHHHHAKWNLRANWIIEAATTSAQEQANRNKLTSRELEAALFMIGDDLSYSL